MDATPVTRRLLTAVLLSCLAVACKTTSEEALEAISAPADMTGWKVGEGEYRPGVGSRMQWIPVDEELGSWTQMATVQFMEGYRMKPAEVVAKLEATLRRRCPSRFWNVIDEGAHSVTYEWSVDACEDQENLHELARLMQGNDGLHRISYACKTTEIDPETRAYWLGVFARAYVAKGDPTKPIVVR